MYIKEAKAKEKRPFIDIRNEELTPLIVEPNEKQEEFEARRLWEEVTVGLTKKGLDYATEKKTAIEDNQRLLVKKRADEGIEWKPRFFVPSDDEIHTYISPLDK